MKAIEKIESCSMCGATDVDSWESNPNRTVEISLQPRHGADGEKWIICDECFEGLQNAAPIKPDRLQLLVQLRRATIDDQKAVLEWLLTKFKLEAVEKPNS